MTYQEALAAVAAALNDERRSLIGDPREGDYKVTLAFTDVRETVEFVRCMAVIGIIPTTLLRHDEFGNPVLAEVRVYSLPDLRSLLELTRAKLSEKRAKQLEDLVLARGPIPDELVERIWKAKQNGWSHADIVDELEKRGFVTGMGKRWTIRKVQDAIKAHALQNEKAAVETGSATAHRAV